MNASTSVPGTFVYNPIAGTVLGAKNQALNVTFTPTDYTNYTNVSKSVSINVQSTTPEINWSNPADIVYGTALSNTQLNANASVPGTFNYTPARGTVLGAKNQTLNVTFTPTDTTNYTNVSKNITIKVLQATPIIYWSSPAAIHYGTALSSTQLNANASVPGIFVYTPVAGTVLNAGKHTLHVDFTPKDNANYTNATADDTINVLKAYAYITNSDSNIVSVIDTETNTVTATVSGSALSNPAGVAVTPDGTKVYVTNSGPVGTVSVIDTATNNITAKINVGNSPWGVAVNPAGTKSYVAHQGGSKDLYVINLTNNNSYDKVSVGTNPTGVVVTPDGTKVYVTNTGSINKPGKSVHVINTTNNNVVSEVTVGTSPIGIAVNPAGTKAYVANSVSNSISVINTATNTVIITVPVIGYYPKGVAVTPDGTKVYVTNYNSNDVSVIDTTIDKVIDTMSGFSDPEGIAINKEGTKVYVVNSGNNTVSVIDTINNKVVALPITVGANPIAFGQFIVLPP